LTPQAFGREGAAIVPLESGVPLRPSHDRWPTEHHITGCMLASSRPHTGSCIFHNDRYYSPAQIARSVVFEVIRPVILHHAMMTNRSNESVIHAVHVRTAKTSLRRDLRSDAVEST